MIHNTILIMGSLIHDTLIYADFTAHMFIRLIPHDFLAWQLPPLRIAGRFFICNKQSLSSDMPHVIKHITRFPPSVTFKRVYKIVLVYPTLHKQKYNAKI